MFAARSGTRTKPTLRAPIVVLIARALAKVALATALRHFRHFRQALRGGRRARAPLPQADAPPSCNATQRVNT